MSTDVIPPLDQDETIYPESDGAPLGEGTEHIDWILRILAHLMERFLDEPNVSVHGDLFWYPVKGKPGIRTAPDTMVIFGRPPSKRSSYLQWKEEGIAPQFVMEVESPGNTAEEMARRLEFFETYGVQEYYVYDFTRSRLYGYLRNRHGVLTPIPEMNGWVSPLAGIRFELRDGELRLQHPDGSEFDPLVDALRERRRLREEQDRIQSRSKLLNSRVESAESERDRLRRQAAELNERARLESERAQTERERAERLAARLRQLGVDPEEEVDEPSN